MTTLLDELFENESLPLADDASEENKKLRSELTSCRRRLDRLELVFEGLFTALELHGSIS